MAVQWRMGVVVVTPGVGLPEPLLSPEASCLRVGVARHGPPTASHPPKLVTCGVASPGMGLQPRGGCCAWDRDGKRSLAWP
eukprot:364741-Chlamydomonas_euryale.AAC.23